MTQDLLDIYILPKNNNGFVTYGFKFEEDICNKEKSRAYKAGACDDYDNKDWPYFLNLNNSEA